MAIVGPLYIAARRTNADMANAFAHLITEGRLVEVSSRWHLCGVQPPNRELSQATRRILAEENLAAISRSSLLFAFLTGGASSTTISQAMLAYGLGVRVYLVGNADLVTGQVDLPRVTWVRSFAAAVDLVRDLVVEATEKANGDQEEARDQGQGAAR